MTWKEAYRTEKAVQDIVFRQEQHGVVFNQELAREHVQVLDTMMRAIEQEVEPALPPRKIPASRLHRPPKKRFNKDGEPSALAVKYFKDSLNNRDGVWYAGDTPLAEADQPLEQYEPMRLANHADIKAWLQEQGWVPTMYGERKDTEGKRHQTGPKFTDPQKNLCPNLLKMQDKVPLVRPIVDWLTYRSRRNVILSEKGTGWLTNPRLKVDGRLSASADTIGASTCRFTHKVVANVPRVTSKFGREMRTLFTIPTDWYMVGWDASGLEARMQAHYTAKFDNGAMAKELLDGDIHSKNAAVFNVDRTQAKTVAYALLYGAQPPKLAQTLGCPQWRAREIYEAFWSENWPLQRLKEKLEEYWEQSGRRYIPGLDGRKIVARSRHSLMNALFQSAGIICMKRAMVLMESAHRDNPKAHGLIRYHDEEQWEVHKDLVRFKKFLTEEEAKAYIDSEGRLLGAVQHANGVLFRAYSEIGEAGVKSIRQAGIDLRLRVPLDGEYKVGKNWGDTH